MTTGAFHLTCRHCRGVLVALGPRLGDDALQMLRDHVRALHPSVAVLADAGAGAILAHFDVARTDAP